MSQSLLFEVFFSTFNRVWKIFQNIVAIPSIWGLLFYTNPVDNSELLKVAIPSIWGLLFYLNYENKLKWKERRNPFYLRSSFLPKKIYWNYLIRFPSQSLLFEVFFSTRLTYVGYVSNNPSQSLLFEVFFSTHYHSAWSLRGLMSQSLLFEVFFSTKQSQTGYSYGYPVAIPSIWGLLFYKKPLDYYQQILERSRNPFYLRSSFLRIITRLHSQEATWCRNPFYLRSSFLLLDITFFVSPSLVAIPSIWGLLFYIY